jgi:hypothetical protein
MTNRVARFPVQGRTCATDAASPHEQLRLQDAANLLQALTMATEARDAFLKFAEGTQKPDVFAMFIHLAHAMDQSRVEIYRMMHHEGDDDPPQGEA